MQLKPKTFPKFAPVMIHWLDAKSQHEGWGNLQEDYHPGYAVSVGFFLSQNKECITIAESVIFMEGDILAAVGTPITIPWGMCIKIIELKEVKKKHK